jgi:hypothetical protein
VARALPTRKPASAASSKRKLCARRQGELRGARDLGVGVLDGEPELARQLAPVGRRQGDPVDVVAHLRGAQRQVEQGASARGQRHARRHLAEAVAVDAEAHLAGGARDVGQLEAEAANVARRHEARQAGLHDHRVAHQHVGVRLPDGPLAPDDRHHAHGAVEGGEVEGDGGAPIHELDRTAEEGQHVLGREGPGPP